MVNHDFETSGHYTSEVHPRVVGERSTSLPHNKRVLWNHNTIYIHLG